MNRRQKKTVRASSIFPVLPLAVLLLLLSIGTIFAAKTVWVWMQKPSSFPIKQIQIDGQLVHETTSNVQKIIQAGISGGFFSLDNTQAKAQLLAMPWISRVSFRREWPGTLQAHIHEHQAVARFGDKGVVTPKGVVFYPDVKSIPVELPLLSGPDDQVEGMLNFYQSLNELAKSVRLTITALNLNAQQSWDLTLNNQVRVVLGHLDVLKRFEQFLLVYPKILASSKKTIVLIDLRYPNGFAVQYQ